MFFEKLLGSNIFSSRKKSTDSEVVLNRYVFKDETKPGLEIRLKFPPLNSSIDFANYLLLCELNRKHGATFKISLNDYLLALGYDSKRLDSKTKAAVINSLELLSNASVFVCTSKLDLKYSPMFLTLETSGKEVKFLNVRISEAFHEILLKENFLMYFDKSAFNQLTKTYSKSLFLALSIDNKVKRFETSDLAKRLNIADYEQKEINRILNAAIADLKEKGIIEYKLHLNEKGRVQAIDIINLDVTLKNLASMPVRVVKTVARKLSAIDPFSVVDTSVFVEPEPVKADLTGMHSDGSFDDKWIPIEDSEAHQKRFERVSMPRSTVPAADVSVTLVEAVVVTQKKRFRPSI